MPSDINQWQHGCQALIENQPDQKVLWAVLMKHKEQWMIGRCFTLISLHVNGIAMVDKQIDVICICPSEHSFVGDACELR